MIAAAQRKWLALALLLGVQFMVVLDIAIVNVALPSIQQDLGFSERNLQWVVSAYALFFGGFLLLGGRTADLLGRRRLFIAGLIVFSAASLLSGFAWSDTSLIVARAAQGLGAAMITPAALAILMTTFQEGRERNTALGVWGAVETIGLFSLAGALLAAFGAWEARAKEPLMPFSIFRIRTVAAANISGLILGTVTFSMFLMLTLYMQQVLGYSPMKTGVAYLAVAGTAIVWSTVAAQLVNRVGVKPTITAGMTLLTVGLVFFTQVPVGGAYLGDLLPGFLLIAAGLGFSFVPISIAALAGVQPSEAGLASGLFNTSQQVGGALGIAALSAIATTTTSDEVASGTALPNALTNGFEAAFIWGGVVAAIGIVVSLVLVRRSDLEQPVEEAPEPALE